jgi:hypothetical protein
MPDLDFSFNVLLLDVLCFPCVRYSTSEWFIFISYGFFLLPLLLFFNVCNYILPFIHKLCMDLTVLRNLIDVIYGSLYKSCSISDVNNLMDILNKFC